MCKLLKGVSFSFVKDSGWVMEYLQDILFSNLNAVIRDGGLYSINDGAVWHSDFFCFTQNKFYYVVDGKCCINIEGKEYMVEKGMWFFIPAGTPHSYHGFSDVNFKKYWIHFEIYPNSDIFRVLGLKDFVYSDKQTDRLFAEYVSKNQSRKLTDKIEIKAILLKLIAKYIELSGADVEPAYKVRDEMLSELLEFINENLSQDLSNGILSGMCHIHPTHFIRYFKQKTGQTPQDYILCRRIEKAKYMLETTGYSVEEIADRVGLCDGPHLSKVFKKFYALSPIKYRNRQRFTKN